LAELANLSEFHFARMFRLSMGCSVHVWVVQQRMALAGRLLKSSPTLSMACVAVSSGFGSASHMNRAFKQHLGVTPLQFRLATAGMRH
jgi:AraC family transcriptional regulator